MKATPRVKVETLADIQCTCTNMLEGINAGCFRCLSLANYYRQKYPPTRPVVGVFFQAMPRGIKQ